MYEEDQKGMLEQIQSLDRPTKWKVLIITTAVIMAIILYVWLGYFNGMIMGNSQQQASDDQSDQIAVSPTAPAAPQTNFFQDVGNGIASAFGGIGSGVRGLVGTMEQPHQYDIQPKSN